MIMKLGPDTKVLCSNYLYVFGIRRRSHVISYSIKTYGKDIRTNISRAAMKPLVSRRMGARQEFVYLFYLY